MTAHEEHEAEIAKAIALYRAILPYAEVKFYVFVKPSPFLLAADLRGSGNNSVYPLVGADRRWHGHMGRVKE